VSDNTNSNLSYDRMRTMLVRAAEIRDSEQQQVFDSLDEIHAKLGGLDALGAVRKRLTELPDRAELGVLAERLEETIARLDAQEVSLDALGAVRKRLTELPDRAEVSLLAERLDQTVGKLDAQDMSLAALVRGFDAVVEKITDRLALPLAGLDSRLDGVAGRFEGIAGRLEGLEDRLSGLHGRLGELDNRLDRHDIRLDAITGAVTGAMRERLDTLDSGVRDRLDEIEKGLHQHLDGSRDGLRSALVDSMAEIRAAMYGRQDALAGQLAALTSRLDQVGDMLVKLVRQANDESERRNASQLDEAMAAIAEMIIGRRGPVAAQAPRPVQRRGRGKSVTTAKDGEEPSLSEENPSVEA